MGTSGLVVESVLEVEIVWVEGLDSEETAFLRASLATIGGVEVAVDFVTRAGRPKERVDWRVWRRGVEEVVEEEEAVLVLRGGMTEAC